MDQMIWNIVFSYYAEIAGRCFATAVIALGTVALIVAVHEFWAWCDKDLRRYGMRMPPLWFKYVVIASIAAYGIAASWVFVWMR